MTLHTQSNTASVHSGEQEPSGLGHRTRNGTHRAGTPVNRSQVAQDTTHAAQSTERAQRGAGAKMPMTLHTQPNTASVHSGEQEPSGPEQRTHNTMHQAGTPVNRSQVAQDTAHAAQITEGAHRRTGAKGPRTLHTQHKALSEQTGAQEPSGPANRIRNTTHRAGTPMNRRQEAQDGAHAAQSTG